MTAEVRILVLTAAVGHPRWNLAARRVAGDLGRRKPLFPSRAAAILTIAAGLVLIRVGGQFRRAPFPALPL